MKFRTPTIDDFPAAATLDSRNFGAKPLKDHQIQAVSNWLDFDRSVAAFDGDRMVGFAGTAPFELTVPGLATIRMRGVTWVSVSPTHSRMGIAGRLMAALDEFAADQGEPVLGLQASNGGIYGRFGYGTSTFCRVVVIDRRETRLAPHHDLDRSRVALMTLHERKERMDRELELFDRYRRARVGECSMSRTFLTADQTWAAEEQVYAEHPDGFAVYGVEPHWNEGHPAHSVFVERLVACTPRAHLDLWATLLASDLAGPVRSRVGVGPGDPLPYLLENPRSLRTVELNDYTWLKVIDPVAAFAARTYRGDDSLVVQVGDTPGRFSVGNGIGGDGIGAVASETEADLVVDRTALGPLLLGSVSATELAAGRRVEAPAEVLDRADVLFGSQPTAHSQVSI